MGNEESGEAYQGGETAAENVNQPSRTPAAKPAVSGSSKTYSTRPSDTGRRQRSGEDGDEENDSQPVQYGGVTCGYSSLRTNANDEDEHIEAQAADAEADEQMKVDDLEVSDDDEEDGGWAKSPSDASASPRSKDTRGQAKKSDRFPFVENEKYLKHENYGSLLHEEEKKKRASRVVSSRPTRDEESCSFQPTISPYAKSMERKGRVEERSALFLKNKRERELAALNEKLQRENEELTFRPKEGDVLERMQRAESERKEKLEKLREANKKDEVQESFRPTISEYSEKLQMPPEKADVYNRLFEASKEKEKKIKEMQEKQMKETTFTPQLNNNSPAKEQTTDQNKFDELYRKAKETREKKEKRIEEERDMKQQHFASAKSNKLLLSRFRTRLTKALADAPNEQSSDDSGNTKISLETCEKIMKELELLDTFSDKTICLMEDASDDAEERRKELTAKSRARYIGQKKIISKMWGFLDPEGTNLTKSEQFEQFLMTTYSLSIGIPPRTKPTDDDAAPVGSTVDLTWVSDEEDRLLLEEVGSYFAATQVIVRNTMASKRRDEMIKEASEPIPESEFKPRINSKSDEMETYNTSRLIDATGDMSGRADKRHEILYYKATKSREKVDKLREEYLAKEKQDCTFQPTVNARQSNQNEDHLSEHDRLYRLSLRNKQRLPYKTREERDLEECTFHPDTGNHLVLPPSPPRISKGVSQHITRIQIARQIDSAKKWDTDLRSSASSKPTSAALNAQPFSFLTRPSVVPSRYRGHDDGRQLLFYVDVQMGGAPVRIPIYEGDDAGEVAHAFAEEHDMDEVAEGKLASAIAAQMGQYVRDEPVDEMEVNDDDVMENVERPVLSNTRLVIVDDDDLNIDDDDDQKQRYDAPGPMTYTWKRCGTAKAESGTVVQSGRGGQYSMYTLTGDDVGKYLCLICIPMTSEGGVQGDPVAVLSNERVIASPPIVKRLAMPGALIENVIIVPEVDVTGVDVDKCMHKWERIKRTVDKESAELITTQGPSFTPGPTEVDYYLRYTVTPVSGDGVRGLAASVTSAGRVAGGFYD